MPTRLDVIRDIMGRKGTQENQLEMISQLDRLANQEPNAIKGRIKFKTCNKPYFTMTEREETTKGSVAYFIMSCGRTMTLKVTLPVQHG